MMKSEGLIRFGTLLLIAVFLNAILMPDLASSKEPDCDFDKKKPSLAHAKKVFDNDELHCARMELDALIKDKKTNLEDRAAARLLIVKVLNAMIHEDLNKPIEEPAKEPVEKPAPPPKETPKDAVVEEQPVVQAQPLAIKSESGGKPWYKKWWAMALGVGVVATVAVVAGGGGGDSDEDEERTWLPQPPPPPGK